MWPLHVLVNKLLGTDELDDEQSDENHWSLVEFFSFRQSVMNGNYDTALLPRSYFVDVSVHFFVARIVISNYFSYYKETSTGIKSLQLIEHLSLKINI